MKILLLEPYFTGSHAAWAEGYCQHSAHDIKILSLPGRFWKWRMHGGAITLARQFLGSDFQPDLLLATDMLDLSTFLALTRPRTAKLPAALYFHENQLTYPWSPTDRDVAKNRDQHYGFINYVSALTASRSFFNSPYHRNSFLAALPQLLKHFPDHRELDTVKAIETDSQVLPLGLDLRRFDAYHTVRRGRKALIVWVHRWEYDKGPAEFFEALLRLSQAGVDFDLAVLGENFSRHPKIFMTAKTKLARHIVHFGYAENFGDYADWLWRADLIPVTSNQDFFGASIAEAVYCNTVPLLPRRLAYPDIMPAQWHAHCFYDNLDDLVTRLQQAITNLDQTREFSLRHVVSQYDWHTMAPQYDRAFAALL